MCDKREDPGVMGSLRVGQGSACDQRPGQACGQGLSVWGRARGGVLTFLCLGHWWDVSRRVSRCVRTVVPFSSA